MSMRLNFLVFSRRARKRFKILLLVIAISMGALLAAESRYAVLRVRSIEADPSEILPERAVWGTVRPEEEKIWPLLWFSQEAYCKNIEAYYPVNLRMRLSGWGRFKLEVLPLEAACRMYWGGRFWYVSEDGRAWLTSLKENSFVRSERAGKLPLLSWSSDRATPIDLSGEHGNIFLSRLPMGKILMWYGSLNELGWSESVRFVQAVRDKGRDVVKLILYAPDGGNGASIVLGDDPEEWRTAASAVKKIFPDISQISRDIDIDTTYKGKILVKNKVQ